MNGALRIPGTAAVGGILAILSGLLAGAFAQKPLIVDLSQHLVQITTGFNGTDLLVFGVEDDERAGSMVVMVRGPNDQVAVRRKARVAGIWVNAEEMTFDAPTYLSVASSGPLVGHTLERALDFIEMDEMITRSSPYGTVPARKVAAFRAALLRRKQAAGLYSQSIEPVTFVGDRLFRTSVALPANVPTGTYTVEVMHIIDGNVEQAAATPLVVSRAGFGATVYDFAHRHSAVYGLLAVLMALAAGWTAGAVFRKV